MMKWCVFILSITIIFVASVISSEFKILPKNIACHNNWSAKKELRANAFWYKSASQAKINVCLYYLNWKHVFLLSDYDCQVICSKIKIFSNFPSEDQWQPLEVHNMCPLNTTWPLYVIIYNQEHQKVMKKRSILAYLQWPHLHKETNSDWFNPVQRSLAVNIAQGNRIYGFEQFINSNIHNHILIDFLGQNEYLFMF